MKKIISIILSLVSLFIFSFPVSAQTINNVSGSVVHGQNITISGSGFGVKNPVAPLMWDDGENKTLNNSSAVLGEGGWNESWPNGTNRLVRGQWQNQYRSSGFRGVSAPHNRSSAYLVGGHWNDSTDMGRNVAVTAAADSYKNSWYASWYIRLDPLWPQTDGGIATLVPNYKDYVFQPGSVSYTGNGIAGDLGQNAFNYSACTNCIVNRTATIQLNNQQICGNTSYGAAARPSEALGWVRNEVMLQKNPGVLKRYHYNGTSRTESYNVQCPAGVDLEDWGIRSFTIGGFMKNSDSPGNPPYNYPNWSAIRDISDHWHTWQQRGSSDEYYVVFNGASIGDTNPDPWIQIEPGIVRVGGVDRTSANKGTVGSLGYGQWAYGDFDGLGYNTVYVRLPAGVSNRNPGSNGYAYVLLTATSGEANGRTHPDAFRYFDDMYIDTTWSRVVLANNFNYDSATIIEPQIPSAWSDGSLTAKVNLGKLPDSGTAYLFVFDANNNHNATGYPVILGASAPPPDTTPPAAPSGVVVL